MEHLRWAVETGCMLAWGAGVSTFPLTHLCPWSSLTLLLHWARLSALHCQRLGHGPCPAHYLPVSCGPTPPVPHSAGSGRHRLPVPATHLSACADSGMECGCVAAWKVSDGCADSTVRSCFHACTDIAAMISQVCVCVCKVVSPVAAAPAGQGSHGAHRPIRARVACKPRHHLHSTGRGGEVCKVGGDQAEKL